MIAIIGNVGTPTAIAAVPIANSQGTLLFGAYTGAGALRKSPPDEYVINYRASYAQETASMVQGLIEHAGLKPNEIAFFTQRDSYGDAGYVGGVTALKTFRLVDESTIAHGPDNHKLISFVLKKAGATVTIAEKGKIALEAKANKTPYNVILMAMQMPVMDGYEATTRLRQSGYTGSIIALTAHAMASDRKKCIDAGCDESATKSINRKELIAQHAHRTVSAA